MNNKENINTALVTIGYTGQYWQRIEDALRPAKIIRCLPQDTDAICAALKEAEIAILDGDIDGTIISQGKKLKWIHCNHSGINNSSRPEVFRRGIILTGSAGRSAPVLAEHVFYLLLSLVYNSRLVEGQQKAHIWKNIYNDSRGLYGKTMGIIGPGYTGREVAARAKAFGMKTLVYGRSFSAPFSNFDKVYDASKGEGIDGLLKESDVIVLTVRLSDATFHLIGKREFSIMKNTALLVNMSRGSVVDEAALAEALKGGEIAGAGSDVFETEPLEEGSPLWDLPNMIITPHCTPEMPDMSANCVDIICENIRLFREGLPLRNMVDARDVYTKDQYGR